MNSVNLSFSKRTFPHGHDFTRRSYFSLLDHFLEFLVDHFVFLPYLLFYLNIPLNEFDFFLLRKSFNLFEVLLHEVYLDLRSGGFCDFEDLFIGFDFHLFILFLLVFFVKSFVEGRFLPFTKR
jgi:hypothetical protein